MTAGKLKAVVILSVLLNCSAWKVAAAKHQEKADAADLKKFASAVKSCDMPALNALIAAGANLSATDAQGNDALSYASLNRRTKGVGSWGTLKCPSAVSALTGAGADPWKARFYQSPRLEENRPGTIALISVQDNRNEKGESGELVQQMTDAIEGYLHATHGPGLKYPVLRLSEARQRLLALGFSAEDTMSPDRLKACKALGVDSVLESSLEDFESSNLVVVSAAGMRAKFALTDCRTGDLLFRTDRDYTMAEGWLVALSGNKVRQIITAPDGPLAFPCYEDKKKK